MTVIRLCAAGDVHGRRYFAVFSASLKSLVGVKPDVCVFAGDMVDEGKVEDLAPIIEEVRSKFPGIPIISIFGNEEYHELEAVFVKRYPDLIWLNDSPAILTVKGVRVGFVGTRGALEKLTFWQRRHKPELARVYRERPKILKKLLLEVKKYADVTVLVSHYAPTFVTVKGEPEKIYPFMGSRDMERMIKEVKPDIVIHAHAHNARVTEARLDSVRVYNVSVPARHGVTLIEFVPRKNLLSFMGVKT